MKQTITVQGYAPVTLHFNSRLARLGGGINNCMTLSARHILVSRDYLTKLGFAHEYGHVRQAQRLGWRYLPWVLWGYLLHGYADSPAELDADDFMWAHFQEFPEVGTVPLWVR